MGGSITKTVEARSAPPTRAEDCEAGEAEARGAGQRHDRSIICAMQSKAASVKEYLASLPADRRAALEAVRAVINANIDKDYEEGMGYGMMGWHVPHRVFPAGYHCDPKQPLPYAGLASQKQHMSLYMMCLYGDAAHAAWFREAWKKAGKTLDMGKSCIRFKRVEDLALEVIGEAIRRTPAKTYVAKYVATMDTRAAKAGQAAAEGKPAPRKKAAKRVVKKAGGVKKKAAKKKSR